MHAMSTALRALPLALFDQPAPITDWLATSPATLSDTQLIEACTDAISKPKADRAGNSFVLHAPLELLARAALLPMVEAAAREPTRRRVAEIAARYAHAGEEVEVEPQHFASVDAAVNALRSAVADGNQATADAALLFLLPRYPSVAIATLLLDPIVTALGAAAHVPILLAELHRVCGRIENVAHLLRAPLHYLLQNRLAALEWPSAHVAPSLDEASSSAQTALARVLARPEPIAVPNHSIATQLNAPQTAGHYARDLGVFSLTQITNIEPVLLRTAAHSMLQDDPKQAPYGWSHCLTMPLALMANAAYALNPSRVAAMAVAEVYAFRASMAQVTIDFQWKPEPLHHRELIAATPSEAASIAFHAAAADQRALRMSLATFAATHRDAHLAKYTLACFDAAARDPDAASLYLAAAAYLGAWWCARETVQRASRSSLI